MSAEQRIDDYIAALAAPQRALAQTLRGLVESALPEAVPAFKWSQPVFEVNGPVCWIKAHKAHVTLGFWRGMQLPSREGAIEGSGEKMGHLKLRAASDIRPALVKKLLREAVALNRERGDPTKSP
jgi:hypothetical protein